MRTTQQRGLVEVATAALWAAALVWVLEARADLPRDIEYTIPLTGLSQSGDPMAGPYDDVLIHCRLAGTSPDAAPPAQPHIVLPVDAAGAQTLTHTATAADVESWGLIDQEIACQVWATTSHPVTGELLVSPGIDADVPPTRPFVVYAAGNYPAAPGASVE